MFTFTIGLNAQAAIDYVTPDPGSEGAGSSDTGGIVWLVLGGMALAIWWFMKIEAKAVKDKEDEYNRWMEEEKAERIDKARLAEEALAAEERTEKIRAGQLLSPEECDIVGRLESLEELKHEGLISEEEYQSKRKAILDSL